LPTKDDFDELIQCQGGINIAGSKLLNGGSSGFNALLGGKYNNSFSSLDEIGFYWTITTNAEGDFWYLSISKDGTINYGIQDVDWNGVSVLSVRCIRD
jgi:uncharacterized protein (TIGR02145 family)